MTALAFPGPATRLLQRNSLAGRPRRQDRSPKQISDPRSSPGFPQAPTDSYLIFSATPNPPDAAATLAAATHRPAGTLRGLASRARNDGARLQFFPRACERPGQRHLPPRQLGCASTPSDRTAGAAPGSGTRPRCVHRPASAMAGSARARGAKRLWRGLTVSLGRAPGVIPPRSRLRLPGSSWRSTTAPVAPRPARVRH